MFSLEPFVFGLVGLHLSMVGFLAVHGRKERSFRQAFYLLFMSTTLADCVIVVAVRRSGRSQERTDRQTHECLPSPVLDPDLATYGV